MMAAKKRKAAGKPVRKMAVKKAAAKKPAAKKSTKPAHAGLVRGMHGMFYSSEADALRLFLRDKVGLRGTDVGGGWLIFNAPEADLGVHPTEGPEPKSGTADISFYCDDIHASVREMKARGVQFTMEVQDHGYGLVTHFKVPGGFDVQLYQPKYRK
jgi:predicted enzyme related to lactoylglutathione lyase